ncbi:MAG: hypothetical protein LUF04_16305 [Bacteroides sp.]|nr:hypothetical protein [Bacteroides sp.]
MNYSRFFTILKRIPGKPDRKDIIRQFTGGRTDSLRGMTAWEFDRMCDALDAQFKDDRTRARSVVLKLMQQLGIDTTDWNRINAFSRDPRIAGKEFRVLKLGELEALAEKLRGIQRKGGLRPLEPTRPEPKPEPSRQTVLFIPPFEGLPN